MDDTASVGGWWARRPAEAATGFKKKSGWLVSRLIVHLTQGARRKTRLAREEIEHDAIPQAAADSLG